MKYINLIAISLLIFGCKENKKQTITSNELIVVEQDYVKALNIASREDKLLFIDFYTTWCAPCKKLDKLVFKNDSIKQILGKDFVLLKYDAENDTVFNLSKKHHISSYPTGLILNNKGYVINRKYGFPGDDSKSLQNKVIEFTEESIALNNQKKILKGYSNKIDISKYPKFYIDYVNRTNTKVKNSDISNYLTKTQDVFSEEYFSTLIYFGRDAPLSISDMVLKNKEKYITLYGKKDVETLLYFLSSAKFDNAISENSQEKYSLAVKFTKKSLNEEWVNDIVPYYNKEFLKAQNKWDEVFEINKKLKDEGKFDNGYINHFSWQVYEKCENQGVIEKCLEWMKNVTDQEPSYAYLDTYAHLMHKSGNKKETKRIVKLAIEAAKKEGKSIKELEELMNE